LGGNATSGNATDNYNIINSITSSSSLTGANLQTQTDNVTGGNGNIILDLLDLLNPALSSTATTVPDVASNLSNNTTINNDINLTALTGNASVEYNQQGGNATSGNALTEATVINMINSLLSDNQSFSDVLNLYGNLQGNILIPQSLLDELLSSPTTTTSGGNPPNGSTTDTNSNNVAINNLITLLAESGSATDSNNMVGGSATTGTATTNENVDNLINNQITGGNVLIIFVNVIGSWNGSLVGAPAGDTVVVLGSGITQDSVTPASTTSNILASNTETINNDINLTSISGNATVSNNRFGGNATSGNATADLNLVNILGSYIDLSGWLGILTINVYGNWDGNVAILPTATTTSTTSPSGGSSGNPQSNTSMYVVYFSNASTLPEQSSQPAFTASAEPVTAPATAATSSADHLKGGPTGSSFSGYIIPVVLLFVGMAIMIIEQVWESAVKRSK